MHSDRLNRYIDALFFSVNTHLDQHDLWDISFNINDQGNNQNDVFIGTPYRRDDFTLIEFQGKILLNLIATSFSLNNFNEIRVGRWELNQNAEYFGNIRRLNTAKLVRTDRHTMYL